MQTARNALKRERCEGTQHCQVRYTVCMPCTSHHRGVRAAAVQQANFGSVFCLRPKYGRFFCHCRARRICDETRQARIMITDGRWPKPRTCCSWCTKLRLSRRTPSSRQISRTASLPPLPSPNTWRSARSPEERNFTTEKYKTSHTKNLVCGEKRDKSVERFRDLTDLKDPNYCC